MPKPKFIDKVFNVTLKIKQVVDAENPRETPPWKWNWKTLLHGVCDVREVVAHAPDGMRQLDGDVPSHGGIALGFRVFYAPWGVNNDGEVRGRGWYIQIEDCFNSSDAMGPFGSLAEAVDGAEHTFGWLPWYGDSKREFEDWEKELTDDGPKIEVL